MKARNIILAVFLGLAAGAVSYACGDGGGNERSGFTATSESRKSGAGHGSQSFYDQALAAFDADSAALGERLLTNAISAASKEGNLHTMYLAQLRMAESLAWGNSEAALAMARQALETYERHPDSERNHIIILDYIGTYASQVAFNTDGSYDEALTYTLRAHTLAEASRDSLGTELVCQTLTSLANIHWAMEDFSAALSYARRAEACAPEELLTGARQVVARCLVSCDSLAAAERVYSSMEAGNDVQLAYIIESNLAKLALRRGATDEAEAAIDSAFAHAEELYYKALQQKDDHYQAILKQESENQRLRYASALQRRSLIGGAVFVVLIAVAVAVAVRSRLRLSEQRRAAEHRQMEQERRLHEQERLMHEQEREMHEREAAAQAERLRQRDATVAFLQDFILQRSEVIQKLGTSNERHVALSPHEWEEVERTIDAIDGERFVRLRQCYPSLREEDVQLCILTRLGLTNRAIGNIYGLTISAVQHRKQKLKKETFGETNPDIALEQVLDFL